MNPEDRSDEFWELAIAVNAAFKGLLASMGESGHICASIHADPIELDLDQTWSSICDQLVKHVSPGLIGGEVIVVADKVVAAGLDRVAPRTLVFDPDPKTTDPATREKLAATVQDQMGMVVTSRHLLLADEYSSDRVTLGTDDPQTRCVEIAERLHEATGVWCDVVISDTDTGLDVREPLINTLTIAATPIGATAGLTVYEAMRCAVAAEFFRGHTRGLPIAVCVPADRRRERPHTGRARAYSGFLDAEQENGLSHA